jgi:hypothetical protein
VAAASNSGVIEAGKVDFKIPLTPFSKGGDREDFPKEGKGRLVPIDCELPI